MGRRGNRVTLATGVYQDSGGIAAVVSVGSGDHFRSKEERFPLGTDLEKIEKWRRRTKSLLRATTPTKAKPAGDTLSADIDRFLATIADRTQRQYAEIQLTPWRDALGTKHRHAITSVDLRTVLAAWQNPAKGARRYAANTLNHRLTALRKLYVVLDADDEFAPNPTLKVKKLREPDAEPREIPEAFIAAIFAELPHTSPPRRKLSHDQAMRIHEEASRPAANRSAIARRYRVSETMVRKLAAKAPAPPVDYAALTYARLWVRSVTGFPPKQVMQLRREHVDEAHGAVWMRPRRKGKGSAGGWVPVTPEAFEALRHFFAIGADGEYDTTHEARAWSAAVKAARDAYRKAGKALPPLPAKLRPYDLRHSFLTRAWRASKDRKGVQQLGQHADPRTTDRYTLGAVDEGARTAIHAMQASELRLKPGGTR
jgi:site-specific recombinase XerC